VTFGAPVLLSAVGIAWHKSSLPATATLRLSCHKAALSPILVRAVPNADSATMYFRLPLPLLATDVHFTFDGFAAVNSSESRCHKLERVRFFEPLPGGQPSLSPRKLAHTLGRWLRSSASAPVSASASIAASVASAPASIREDLSLSGLLLLARASGSLVTMLGAVRQCLERIPGPGPREGPPLSPEARRTLCIGDELAAHLESLVSPEDGCQPPARSVEPRWRLLPTNKGAAASAAGVVSEDGAAVSLTPCAAAFLNVRLDRGQASWSVELGDQFSSLSLGLARISPFHLAGGGGGDDAGFVGGVALPSAESITAKWVLDIDDKFKARDKIHFVADLNAGTLSFRVNGDVELSLLFDEVGGSVWPFAEAHPGALLHQAATRVGPVTVVGDDDEAGDAAAARAAQAAAAHPAHGRRRRTEYLASREFVACLDAGGAPVRCSAGRHGDDLKGVGVFVGNNFQPHAVSVSLCKAVRAYSIVISF
jgi:hypothetical protein